MSISADVHPWGDISLLTAPGTLTIRPRTIRPRTMRPRTKCPLDNPSPGQSVPWTIRPLDDPSLG
jgi:hypothetical protein